MKLADTCVIHNDHHWVVDSFFRIERKLPEKFTGIMHTVYIYMSKIEKKMNIYYCISGEKADKLMIYHCLSQQALPRTHNIKDYKIPKVNMIHKDISMHLALNLQNVDIRICSLFDQNTFLSKSPIFTF